jgi:hypothetical protein
MIYGLMAVYIGELQPYCNFCEPFLILEPPIGPHLSVFSLLPVLISNWLPLDTGKSPPKWASCKRLSEHVCMVSGSDLRIKNPYYEAPERELNGFQN